MAHLWLEAEAFEKLGGWVVDSQSMSQMGSAYVMAHGMGIPVADAETVCDMPETGHYTVWVRTRDWTAIWKRGSPAGRFNVIVNGTVLPEILGTNGNAWAWQKAGAVKLAQGKTKVALHDLTGFNGRCDALYFTTDSGEIPENEPDKLSEMRRNRANIVCEDMPDEYDLVVAGGGIAGICTAVAAIRSGAKVALIQDRPVLGGCNSSEIRVLLGGWAHVGTYSELGNVVSEIGPVAGEFIGRKELYEDERKENIFRLFSDSQYTLALNERVVSIDKADNDAKTIRAVITRNTRTGAEKRYRARLFADCTGDAVIARLAGAETMYGREAWSEFNESLAPETGDRQVMGMSVQWCAEMAAQPVSFPDIDWGIEFTDANAYFIRRGEWDWETGQYRDQAEEAEYIRDYGLMVTYANWSFLKNCSVRKNEWACDALQWVSFLGGKRESYRVIGDYVLSQNDIENHTVHTDATGAMSWDIDLHFPEPANVMAFKEPFRSCAYHRGIEAPYPVPYRCLYARDVKNLFLGGRHISMSHVAFACVRVMRTLGILGEVIGMAAGICTREKCYPRDVYGKYFDKLAAMMKTGIKFTPYHAYKADDVEKYHFKDYGFIHVYPAQNDTPVDEAFKCQIKALNICHKHKTE